MQPGSRCQWYNSHGAATLIRPRRPLPTNPFSAKPAIAQGDRESPEHHLVSPTPSAGRRYTYHVRTGFSQGLFKRNHTLGLTNMT
ncbi:hypothetical protein IAQ61_011488 [Plenodomus lingam]|uniref:uncharacterized protein n=1 Tax=Leptosphaeria maculans TaxID=5022 RepID=UPI003331BA9A|nr:hypothetical protein IAQ61_011488 [Plenodomus lingam]